MVCLGNICRSPLAEGIMQQKAQRAGLNWTVDSAGTGGWQRGESPHKLSVQIAAQHGIDISHQKARAFEPADMQVFDLVFFMDEDNLTDGRRIAGNLWNNKKAALLTKAQWPNKKVNVPDPYYGTFADYETVYQMIDSACEAIIHSYQR
ncbi:MAG: low molecular weight phosphotyrosine protein phosphatase [Bacteroidetes bacterium]|nr:MAG: low molecular weight phosphotyrosine protein phosphatase [Bacteroidota bacterium]